MRQTSKYDPEKACEDLYRSMEGLGTDEDGIIKVVCSHSFHQRQELKQIYQEKYSKVKYLFIIKWFSVNLIIDLIN